MRDTEQAWLDVAGGVLAHVRSALGFEMAVLARRSGDSYVVLGADDDQYGVRAGDVLPWADTFCARMADGRAPRVAPDVGEVPAYVEAAELLGMDVGAYVSIPLRDADGVLLGSLCAASPRPHSDGLLAHQALLEVLAETVGALLSTELRLQREARRAERAEAAAHADPLTGLGNRRLWDRALASEERRCASYGLSCAVVAVDVDGLKALNDSVGHDAGDALLQELLDLARRQLGTAISFVGEWRGGPSGVRVMRGLSSDLPLGVGRGATEPLDDTYCQRIVDGRLPRVIPDTAVEPEALALPVTAALPIGSYVGVPVVLSDGQLYGTLCCLSPTADHGLSERDADFLAAIAHSMARVLEAELERRAIRSSLVARLDPVLRGRGLQVVFQPVVSLVDGSLAGVEALARFGVDGTGAPARWFADANVAGLTGELELAAARAALAAAPQVPGFLALNFSATTICSPGFATLLEQHDPARLVVEVSEHEAIADYAPVLEALRPWRGQGLRVAVDDAGAGFASLRHVVLLAPDLIKLDLSLVRGIDTDRTRQALAAALTTFARSAGAQVVAEGVETVQEREVLAAAGVGLVQGWLTGAGVPADDVQTQYGPGSAVPYPRAGAVELTG